MTENTSLPIAMRSKGLNVFLLKLILKNIPGALAKVSTLMAKYNINILSSIIDAPLDSAKAKMISFIECGKVKTPIDEVTSKLRGLDVVLDVEMVKPQHPNLIINDLMYPITFMGVRGILIHIAGLGEVLKYLYSKFGSSAKVLMYYAGYGSIKGMVKGLKRATGLRDERLLDICLKMFKAVGFGDFKITYYNLNPIYVVVEAYDLFECTPFKNKLKEPNSQVFRGILAGIVEEITGKRVTSVEEKCIAKGDPYCQFTIKQVG